MGFDIKIGRIEQRAEFFARRCLCCTVSMIEKKEVVAVRGLEGKRRVEVAVRRRDGVCRSQRG
jgi:hypothetical protein